jgi:hypothetical protein
VTDKEDPALISEAFRLRVMLSDRIKALGINRVHDRYIRDEFDALNLDGLRCLDKFMHSNTPRIIFNILGCQKASAERLGQEGATFLTQEMLDASARAYRAITDPFYQPIQDNLNALLFMNMDRADEIFSLLENDGITDAREIEAILNAPYSVPKSLRGGVL